MTTVFAVFEGGLLRPVEPLALPEGRTVRVTVEPSLPVSPLRTPTAKEEGDYARRLQSAATLEEMLAIMANAPETTEGDSDVVEQINESRRLTGFRMPDPGPAAEGLR